MLQRVRTDGHDKEKGQQEGDEQGHPDGEWLAGLCGVDGQREEQQVKHHSEPEAGVVEDAGRHVRGIEESYGVC